MSPFKKVKAVERDWVTLGQSSKMADVKSTSLFVVLLSVSVGILLQFQTTQPEPYMDEIFHIPQAQKYCEYKFKEWDPMITTLPGLYLVSFILLRITSFFTTLQLSVLCSVFWLRFTNILFMIGNAWVLRKLLLKLHNEEEAWTDAKVCLKYNLLFSNKLIVEFLFIRSNLNLVLSFV
jgi:alpha-1,2-glucosyltransferase